MIPVVRHAFARGIPPTMARPASGKVAVCIGNFDGVHAGHQELFARARNDVGGRGTVAVVSFYPNPAAVLGKTHDSAPLQTFRLQYVSLERAGVDAIHLMHFTQAFSRLTANEFLERYILPLNPLSLVLGSDARVGYGGSGDVSVIEQFGRTHGFRVHVVPFAEQHGNKISSRHIRGLIQAGEVRAARSLLTRDYILTGRTSKGEQRGRTIGFPTLNLHSFTQVMPAHGVYATLAVIEGKAYPAVTNVGIRPTVGGKEERVETHVIGEILPFAYGTRLDIHFVERLRAERRFASVEELKDAIAHDVQEAQKVHVQRAAQVHYV